MRPNSLAFHTTLLFALTQFACTSDESALGEQPTLSGQIENWDRGSGYTLQGVNDQGGLNVLTTGPVDSKGVFHIVLPSRAAMTPFLVEREVVLDFPPDPGCTGGRHYDMTILSIARISFRVKKEEDIIEIKQGNSNVFLPIQDHYLYVEYEYIFRGYTETADYTCSISEDRKNGSRVKFDTQFKTGWNRSLNTWSWPQDQPMFLGSVTGPLPAEVKWFLLNSSRRIGKTNGLFGKALARRPCHDGRTESPIVLNM